jgi:purine-binding chemotaxis protein CheW
LSSLERGVMALAAIPWRWVVTVMVAGGRAPGPGGSQGDRWLLCRAGRQVCALRLRFVIEVMRPVAVEPLAAMPEFVRGVCVARGTAVPVVDLPALLGRSDGPSLARLVAVLADGDPDPDPGVGLEPHRHGAYAAGRVVALGVSEVMGLAAIAPEVFGQLPPLLDATRSGAVASVGVAGQRSLVAIDTARLFPEELWERVRQAFV